MDNDDGMEKYGVPPDPEKTAALEKESEVSGDRDKCSVCGHKFGDCDHTRVLKK